MEIPVGWILHFSHTYQSIKSNTPWSSYSWKWRKLQGICDRRWYIALILCATNANCYSIPSFSTWTSFESAAKIAGNGRHWQVFPGLGRRRSCLASPPIMWNAKFTNVRFNSPALAPRRKNTKIKQTKNLKSQMAPRSRWKTVVYKNHNTHLVIDISGNVVSLLFQGSVWLD